MAAGVNALQGVARTERRKIRILSAVPRAAGARAEAGAIDNVCDGTKWLIVNGFTRH
jgi:hypothetical protein